MIKRVNVVIRKSSAWHAKLEFVIDALTIEKEGEYLTTNEQTLYI